MDARDLAIRNLTYRMFVEGGRAPTSVEVAAAAGTDINEIATAWRRLHDTHAIVLDLPAGELRMANPFSAVPTPFRVHTDGRSWYANCAWDAFGICAAMHDDGDIETLCADCQQRIAIAIRAQRPDDDSLLFHCFVPAAGWWDDIVHT